MKEVYDAIIIGSGAGGGTVAYRLSRAGMKVLLLEQGPRFDRLRDYPLDRNDWETVEHFEKRNPDSYTSSPQFLGEEGMGLMSTLYGRRVRSIPEANFKYERASGLGGSTLRYQAEAHRFPAHAFRMKSLFGLGEDWPITYEGLEPYYQQAEDLLGVAGNHRNPYKPARGSFTMPAHPLGCPSQTIKKGADKLGLSLLQNSLAIPTRPYNGRPACIYCRGCGYGCVIGDKGSTDIVMIEPAEARGTLTVKTNARALRIEVDEKGKAESIIWKGHNGKEKSYAKVIVVSCGAIETPRLLLNSRSSLFPDGLANTSGLVGSYLMTHLAVALLIFLNNDVKSYSGLPIDARIWDYSSPANVKKQGGGIVLGVMGAPEGLVSPASFATHLAPGWGKSHKEFMQKYYGSHSAVFAVAEHIPKIGNSVTLSNEKDNDGLQKAMVISWMAGDDLKLLRTMIKRCEEVALASGARVSGVFTSLDTMGSTHVAGTMRMGVAPSNSVVNSFGQCHDVQNLFIADASVLVTQGCGDSPSLTIMALALRTAEHIVEEMKKGNL